MPETALFQLVDRYLNGELAGLLAMWRRAGVSKRAAANLLAEALDGIEIHADTVLRWMKELSADPPTDIDEDNGDEAAA